MKYAKRLTIVIIALAIGVAGVLYWHERSRYVGTDDAYTNAHVVRVASRVSGPILRLYVHENQVVGADAPLFDIDPAPFELNVKAAQARLEEARQQVGSAQARLAAAEAAIAARQSTLRNALLEKNRSAALAAQQYLPRNDYDNAVTAYKNAAAALREAQAQKRQAEAELGAVGARNPAVRQAQAQLKTAELNLAYTHVKAPGNGLVTKLNLRPGSYVQAGTPLFAFIEGNQYWVDANLKETDMDRIRPGLAATVQVDMYPNKVFKGVVESISGGSGTAFSLLPAENATGNWVKVTQRVPVRVRILNPDPRYPLPIGVSAIISIDTGVKRWPFGL